MAEWKDTCNLPRTAFPMKANLQTTEPETIARWDAMDLYGQIRAGAQGRAAVRAARRPAVRQRRHPHRHGAQQDPQGHRRQVAQRWRGFDAPYVPGWDCHGLPIELKVDRELGPKKREMTTGRVPPRVPRLRREVRRASSARSSSGSASSATGTTRT